MQYIYKYIFLISIIPSLSFGAGNPGVLMNPLGGVSTISAFLNLILDIVVKIGTPIAVLFIIYSGFLFVTARGDSGQITKAKETFMWTIIGTLILFGARLLGTILENTAKELVV